MADSLNIARIEIKDDLILLFQSNEDEEYCFQDILEYIKIENPHVKQQAGHSLNLNIKYNLEILCNEKVISRNLANKGSKGQKLFSYRLIKK